MTARRQPYPDPGFRLSIPSELWQEALATLRAYGRFKSEGLVYLSGVTASQNSAVVTGLLCLGHAPQGGTVVVTPEESRWLLKTLRQRDEKLLAQLHSHAGQAFHSWGDDERAASFHRGFVSIVAPDFARRATGPKECAVYEFNGESFVQMEAGAVNARITLVPGRVELRPIPTPPPPPIKRLWNAFVRKPK